MDLQTALRVEQEKMTRRAALRKLGFGAGLAAFSMLGVDDLARMVGQRMERMAGDNKVATQVAKEFQEAGLAMAAGTCSGSANYADCKSHPTASGPITCCQGKCTNACGSNEGALATCQQVCADLGGSPG